MSSEWRATTLGEVSIWASGGTPKKDEPTYWGGDIPWISANSMHATRFVESDLTLTEAGLKNGSRLASKDTVLLLVRGSALHSRMPVGIALRDLAFNQDVKAITAKTNQIRPWYLLYWLMGNEKFILDSVVEFTGIGAGKLDTKRMQGLDLILPPLAVQDEILESVKSIDDRITLLRETNTNLEAIAQALFKSWFVDFDPVHAKMQGRAPEGMDEATADLFPDSFEESELGAVPKGWSVGNLNSLAELNPESWSAKHHPERVLYVDLANTKAGQIDEYIELSFENAPSRARRALRRGDVIVGTVRPGNRSFARIASDVTGLTGSTGFAVLRARVVADQALVYLAATNNEAIDRLSHLADGGAYPAVRPEVVGTTPLVVAPEEIRNSFGEIANPLFASIGLNQERIRQLGSLRDTLLPRLISGQQRLPDRQAIVASLA